MNKPGDFHAFLDRVLLMITPHLYIMLNLKDILDDTAFSPFYSHRTFARENDRQFERTSLRHLSRECRRMHVRFRNITNGHHSRIF